MASAGASFGDLLRHYRTLAGMSQEALAEQAGLTPNAIGALERGVRRRPHPHTIRALADALRLSTEDRSVLIAATAGRGSDATPAAPLGQQAGLPVPPTPLIGRAQAVAEVSALLRQPTVRLVTLTGVGGVGKTRLALEVARSIADEWPDGVAFVSLAPIMDSGLLIPTIARTIGLQETRSDLVREQLFGHLRGRRMLLVLDNMEHLLEAVGDVAELLAMTEAPSLLVTSRRPLQIRGELDVPVEPLAFDSATGDAIELFAARARDVSPTFALTDDNTATVAEICRQLGGLPLAIELAAAWIRILTPDGLLARLSQVLGVEGARDLPSRQRTMRATLDWSHSLLSQSERVLFRRLAVFAGGFTLEAAEAVCPDELHPVEEVLASVSRLVEDSLLTVQPGSGPVRYVMLEPVRQYAGEHLAASGEGAALRGRHADYYLALAEQAETGLVGPDQARWLRLFDAEHPNLRAALRWLTDQGEFERLVDLAWGIVQFWVTRGHYNEGARWLAPVLAQDDRLSETGRIRLRYLTAFSITGQGRLDEAFALADEAAEMAQASGHGRLGGMAHGLAAGLAAYKSELEMAQPHAEAARAWYSRNPWEWLTLGTHTYDTLEAIERGDLGQARRVLATAEAEMRAAGCWWPLMHVINLRCQVAVAQGDAEGAAEGSREAVTIARQHIGVTLALPDSLALLGGALVVAGYPLPAARLFGAVEALRERLGDTMIVASRRAGYEQHVARIKEQIGADTMAEVWQAGRIAPLDEVIEESLAMFPPQADGSDELTQPARARTR